MVVYWITSSRGLLEDDDSDDNVNFLIVHICSPERESLGQDGQ